MEDVSETRDEIVVVVFVLLACCRMLFSAHWKMRGSWNNWTLREVI